MAQIPPTVCKYCQKPIPNGGFFNTQMCTSCANKMMQIIAGNINANATAMCQQCGGTFKKSSLQGGLCAGCYQKYQQRIQGTQTGRWRSAWFSNLPHPVISGPPSSEQEVQIWIKRLEQFPDLPTEYPEDFYIRRDLDIFLEAIHELGDYEINTFKAIIEIDCFTSSLILPCRKLNAFDALIIREYVHRTLKRIKEEKEAKEREERIREEIKKEEWYLKFPEQLRYRLETCIEHRLAQREAERLNDDNAARNAFQLFKQALAYGESLKSDLFFAEDDDRFIRAQELSRELAEYAQKDAYMSQYLNAYTGAKPQTILTPKQQRELNQLNHMRFTKQITDKEYQIRAKAIKGGK